MCDYGPGDFVICVAEDSCDDGMADGPEVNLGDILCVLFTGYGVRTRSGRDDPRLFVSFHEHGPDVCWPTEMFRLQQPRDPDLLAKLLSERAPPDLVGA